jgi:hypothetical protein
MIEGDFFMNVNIVNHEPVCTGGIGIQTKTEESRTDTVVSAFENVFVAGSQPMNSTDVTKSAIGQIRDSLTDVEDALKADAQVAKDNLKALFNKLSGAEAVAMDEDGWDLNDMDSDEILTVVDRIKIMLATYCDNYQIMSGDIDTDLIEEAVGDAGLAAKVSQKLSGTYVPATDDNVREVEEAVDVASRLPETLDTDTIKYLMKNDLEPTIANVYKAQHSTATGGGSPLSDRDWQQLLPQVDGIIQKTGQEPSQELRDMAKSLIEWQVDLTPENLMKLDGLENLNFTYSQDTIMDTAVNAMSDGKRAQDALVTGAKEPAWKTVSEAVKILQNATEQDVENVTMQYGNLTIARLSFSMSSVEGYMAANISVETSEQVLANNRTLNEARLMLTAYSGKALLDSGIDIFHEDLKNIADLLHESQVKYVIDDFTKQNAGSISEEDLNKVSGFEEALYRMRFMPSAAIGAVVSSGVTVSVMSLQYEGSSLQQKYEQAGQAYETMSTKVRADMGDNLKKAVDASADTVLSELGLENTKQNVRSVHILAANQMEMTEENIYTINNLDFMLNQVMDNITPQTVLDMIRDGVNPMDAEISVLNGYVEEKQENITGKVEKFSEFLYELDRNKEITSEEREKYIGVYKMFNMFKKDAGKAIGALVNQGSEVTLENLVMAIDSRRKYDMDVTLDTDAGMAEISGKTAYFENLFSSLGKKITPDRLKNSESEEGEETTLETLFEQIETDDETEQMEQRAAFYQQELEWVEDFSQDEDRMIRMLTDYKLPVTFHNLMGARSLTRSGGKLLTDAIEGEQKEKLSEDMEGILEALDSEEDAQEAYKTFREDVNDTVRELLSGDEAQTLDLRELRCLTEGVRLMGALSEKHDYIIPFETEEGAGLVNLKLVHSDEDSGRISIHMDYADGRQAYLDCGVSKEHLDIFMVEQNDIQEDAQQQLTAGLEELGFTQIRFNSVTNDTVPYGNGSRESGTPTALLYKTAQTLVKNLLAAKAK